MLKRTLTSAKYSCGKDRLEDAVRNFQHALRIEPAVVEIHENLARALARQGKKKELFSITRKLCGFRSHVPKTLASVDSYLRSLNGNRLEHGSECYSEFYFTGNTRRLNCV